MIFLGTDRNWAIKESSFNSSIVQSIYHIKTMALFINKKCNLKIKCFIDLVQNLTPWT